MRKLGDYYYRYETRKHCVVTTIDMKLGNIASAVALVVASTKELSGENPATVVFMASCTIRNQMRASQRTLAANDCLHKGEGDP